MCNNFFEMLTWGRNNIVWGLAHPTIFLLSVFKMKYVADRVDTSLWSISNINKDAIWFSIIKYYIKDILFISIKKIPTVHYLCFSMCLFET